MRGGGGASSQDTKGNGGRGGGIAHRAKKCICDGLKKPHTVEYIAARKVIEQDYHKYHHHRLYDSWMEYKRQSPVRYTRDVFVNV